MTWCNMNYHNRLHLFWDTLYTQQNFIVSTLDELLFYTEVSLTVILSNNILYKNLSSQIFLIGKHFIVTCNITALRANV